MNKGYALITGASSGIGKEFALQLSEEGYTPILVSRRQDLLNDLSETIHNKYGLEPIVYPCDLLILSNIDELFSYINTLNMSVDIVINNAGFGDCGAFLETDINKDLSMIDLNIKTLHYVMKKTLKIFSEQNYGMLLNVASSAGLFFSGPYMSTYYATKSYVTSISGAVSTELKEQGYRNIYVMALCPGPVNTEFNEIANVRFALKGLSAERCVSSAIRGMKKHKRIIIPGITLKLGIFFNRFLPRGLSSKIVGHQQKKKL